MSLFQRKAEEKRSIEEILTPKSESEIVAEEETEGEPITIKSETAEEFTNNALDCFGWREIKTEKWLIRSARIWYGIMSFFWFLFGAITFAPIIFISKKVNVILKHKTKSLIFAMAIWCIFVGLIILMFVTRNLEKAKDIEQAMANANQTFTIP